MEIKLTEIGGFKALFDSQRSPKKSGHKSDTTVGFFVDDREVAFSMKGVFFDEKGRAYLVICPKCGKENWAMAVATGVCTWCGYIEPDREVKE